MKKRPFLLIRYIYPILLLQYALTGMQAATMSSNTHATTEVTTKSSIENDIAQCSSGKHTIKIKGEIEPFFVLKIIPHDITKKCVISFYDQELSMHNVCYEDIEKIEKIELTNKPIDIAKAVNVLNSLTDEKIMKLSQVYQEVKQKATMIKDMGDKELFEYFGKIKLLKTENIIENFSIIYPYKNCTENTMYAEKYIHEIEKIEKSSFKYKQTKSFYEKKLTFCYSFALRQPQTGNVFCDIRPSWTPKKEVKLPTLVGFQKGDRILVTFHSRTRLKGRYCAFLAPTLRGKSMMLSFKEDSSGEQINVVLSNIADISYYIDRLLISGYIRAIFQDSIPTDLLGLLALFCDAPNV